MNDLCVFCGKQPDSKTQEHVIPQWLMQLTGDPHREGIFGPFYTGKKLEMRKFSFEQFAFPACEQCNQRMSELEGSTKRIMLNILAEKSLSAADMHVLLSWLDKVRIGLWLAFYIVQRNLLFISPQFHINSRMDMSDRLVLIYKSDYPNQRLNFNGAHLPAFQLNPTCFYLIVNNYYFFNVATHVLLSKRFGLPYATGISYTNTPQFVYEMTEGSELMTYPLIKIRYERACSQIFQPMFTTTETMREMQEYRTEYVASMMMNQRKGIGKIFYYDGSRVREFPSESECWVPPKTWRETELRRIIFKQMLDFQLHLMRYGPLENKKVDCSKVTKEKKQMIRQQHAFASSINRILLRRLGASA